ncbi:MAG: hypothetical protein MZV63_21590 [Marinilabiliales bacterium]|nr:hypothetical protein [Marinilabiliales bacterium]
MRALAAAGDGSARARALRRAGRFGDMNGTRRRSAGSKWPACCRRLERRSGPPGAGRPGKCRFTERRLRCVLRWKPRTSDRPHAMTGLYCLDWPQPKKSTTSSRPQPADAHRRHLRRNHPRSWRSLAAVVPVVLLTGAHRRERPWRGRSPGCAVASCPRRTTATACGPAVGSSSFVRWKPGGEGAGEPGHRAHRRRWPHRCRRLFVTVQHDYLPGRDPGCSSRGTGHLFYLRAHPAEDQRSGGPMVAEWLAAKRVTPIAGGCCSAPRRSPSMATASITTGPT